MPSTALSLISPLPAMARIGTLWVDAFFASSFECLYRISDSRHDKGRLCCYVRLHIGHSRCVLHQASPTSHFPLYYSCHHFGRLDRILLNGFRSGTDTYRGPISTQQSESAWREPRDLLCSLHRLVSNKPSLAKRNVVWFDLRVITTPLLLLDLLLTAGLPWPTILFTILLDEVMIVTGLVGALVHSNYKVSLQRLVISSHAGVNISFSGLSLCLAGLPSFGLHGPWPGPLANMPSC